MGFVPDIVFKVPGSELATRFVSPLTYVILMSKRARNSIQCACLLFNCLCVLKNSRALWSVTTMTLCPRSLSSHFSRASRMATVLFQPDVQSRVTATSELNTGEPASRITVFSEQSTK